ncbi:lysine N(6)-hydroxylase/L-ornithine N(5)-oxygenase family protein [Allokutzneria sp. A3M-2-11 16]|uniref:lysine N(6)-hydroxylase/L-ornithine N(5)-oxygenase family protein n=1 Tax=Allokutzneria sp. A3M-2-11 16 TaxID=2962043 RepID=UPI0020B6C5CF|nr:SidA/IucD/PvdA family monooxygenase [Allokutzneria sp. A3M-2-11 16]MCP3803353.1 lysine N(6)-hydroxylase/L-ornithine N(5)-oxygenase family protein [Allokutzneria sp. A3M-2-11 16]
MEPDKPVIGLLGIGFGPSNLALAIAVAEAESGSVNGAPGPAVFLEKQSRFGWHRDMLIDGATMQVSFLKDLVSLRNPVSEFSFVSYLHQRGRLAEFVNSKTIFPLRVEFHDYLHWAAERFAEQVEYGCEVTAVRPVLSDGVVSCLEVLARRGGEQVVRRARNVVIAAGLTPRLPEGVLVSDRVWHSSTLLSSVERIAPSAPKRFVVVGSGQSAAEATEYLHRRFADAEVHAVFARFGYSVADDSPFTNRIFDAASVDEIHGAEESVRRRLFDYHANTNYAVVDGDLVEELHRRSYLESVTGNRRLHVHGTSAVREMSDLGDRVRLTVESLPTGRHRVIEADAVVYATGYHPSDPAPMLGGLLSQCKVDREGRPVLGRDYRVVTSASMECGIYLHGAITEHSHGISSGLLSNIAVRAGEIAESVRAASAVNEVR